MKTSRVVVLAVTFCLLKLTCYLPAQETAFTYQGHLNDGGHAANGTFDFIFSIYFDSTNGAAQVVRTNGNTVVSNGLFTASIDVGTGGASIFSGPDRWLEMMVRTNGSGLYERLSPRQRFTAAPYAVFAHTASNLAGAISLTQLPAAVMTNNQSAVSLAGDFSGNGAGLTNVPGALAVHVVAGVNVMAEVNSAYTASGLAPTTIHLPLNPSVGDVVHVAGVGAGGWQVQTPGGQTINGIAPIQYWQPLGQVGFWRAIASSADGLNLLAVDAPGQPIVSTNGGSNWNFRAHYDNWVGAAISADGRKMAAVVIEGQIHTSIDGGATWTAREYNRRWFWIASSADGSKLAAVVDGGNIYTSSDSGTNWTAREASRSWRQIASSADGNRLAAVVNDGQIFISNDAGTNWMPAEANRFWRAVASSSDGSTLVALADRIYVSSDGGTNWFPREGFRGWSAVASSADGTKLVATSQNGLIYTSLDAGDSWTASGTARNWYAVAMSADGSKVFAAVNGADIHSPIETTLMAGAQGTSAELRYAGNGVWQSMIPTNHAVLNASQTYTGQNRFINSSNIFQGNGSGLTDLSADSISSGTISDSRLSLNAALLNRNQSFSGLNIFHHTENIFAGNGGYLTGLSAANVSNGTLSDARLSTNVALRSGGNTFLGGQVFNGQIRLDAVEGFSQSSVGNFYIDAPFIVGGRFTVLTDGKVGIGGAFPTNKLHVFGGATFSGGAGANQSVVWTPGSGSWSFTSDRNSKEEITAINTRNVLEKLCGVPISEWRYKGHEQRHIGPTAQDFHAAFPLNDNDKSLNDADLHGVALAAIQGLNRKLEQELGEKNARIAALEQAVQELKHLISRGDHMAGKGRADSL